ncbi:hypothetical protein [Luteimonas aquatica]|uniref:hypothetical protein n=1 Tax=Luteimonas aquatica TaxID=450364 RepID=UPI001F5A563F|nr:hypothetical protein [Luteimonas aquatica]
MSAVVIYGNAVQEARNRLRSAHASTMFEALSAALSGSGHDAQASEFNRVVLETIKNLPEPVGNAVAKERLDKAKTRFAQAVQGDTLHDLFAIGDALRELGDYLAEGGGGADWKAFVRSVRDAYAFNQSANRARQPIPDFDMSQWPQLGVFKFKLLDRSVVKYMERFYGPYLGADISATTTDSLVALAYLLSQMVPSPASTRQVDAQIAIEEGLALIPVASMVLQYHHTLIECELALSLTVPALYTDPRHDGTRLAEADFYDFTVLTNGGDALRDVLEAGNQTLAGELKGHRLVVLRDLIDIRDNPYADCEIGLLLPPSARSLFQLGTHYRAFAQARKKQIMSRDGVFQKADPSLYGIAEEFEADLDLPTTGSGGDIDLSDLVRMNSIDLKALGAAAFDDLDKALATVAQPQPHVDVTGTATPARQNVANAVARMSPEQLAALVQLLNKQ